MLYGTLCFISTSLMTMYIGYRDKRKLVSYALDELTGKYRPINTGKCWVSPGVSRQKQVHAFWRGGPVKSDHFKNVY